MGYLFGAGAVSDVIDCGTAIVKASTFSLFIRFKPTSSNATTRRLVEFRQPSAPFNAQAIIDFSPGGSQEITATFSTSGSYHDLVWSSGFSAGTVHVLVATYDGSTHKLYADTDATAKASVSASGTPDADADQKFHIGNVPTIAAGADATIYEVGWWPGTALTGAQAAQLGIGYDAAFIVPRPANHWRLIGHANDHVGGKNGTVTGATLVAHDARIFYPAAARARRFSTAAAASSPFRAAWHYYRQLRNS